MFFNIWFTLKSLTIIYKLITIYVVRLNKVDVGFSGHIDDLQYKGNMGCGTIDQILVQLEKLKDPATYKQFRGLAKVMFCERNVEGTVDAIIGRAVLLAAYEATYFKKDA